MRLLQAHSHPLGAIVLLEQVWGKDDKDSVAAVKQLVQKLPITSTSARVANPRGGVWLGVAVVQEYA